MKIKFIKYLAMLLGATAFTSCLEEAPNPSVGVPSPTIAIEDVRLLYRDADVTLQSDNLAGAHRIVGVVVSDPTANNLPEGTLVVQNKRRGSVRGIMLDLEEGANAAFSPGDSVIVNILGGTLTNINGSVRLTGLSVDAITKVAENVTVAPREVTAAQLYANPGAYEGTLVRVAAGTIDPIPTSGETYMGDKNLIDGSLKEDSTVATVILHTEATAPFANKKLPASASFTGIPVIHKTADKTVVQLWVRNIADIANASGPVYAGFPENFDAPNTPKGSYNMNTDAVPDNTITLSTGAWKLYQSILGSTNNDEPISAPNAIRMQQNLSVPAVVEMQFDVPNGASKVTLWTMSYNANADKPCKWRLEYSQDQGTTWTQIGEDQWAIKKDKELTTFLMDITGPVRFRVYKYGPGSSNNDVTIQNGRLSFDDFAIYSN